MGLRYISLLLLSSSIMAFIYVLIDFALISGLSLSMLYPTLLIFPIFLGLYSVIALPITLFLRKLEQTNRFDLFHLLLYIAISTIITVPFYLVMKEGATTSMHVEFYLYVIIASIVYWLLESIIIRKGNSAPSSS
ncbi:UPF0715 family protein [Pontibacillus litoralis]|uniref:Uncharacterized protein n=1 Tax=Pontibacillus litoralis JSM 072002 TaxID=1385512 RepID=A0A0A5G7T9_9BACI|nr:UPF0715 family protein [Pontibacillus litoralis]KGX87243.1 hypothetical protein N784_16235 [Pontibacillus litoralis JSM 072002]